MPFAWWVYKSKARGPMRGCGRGGGWWVMRRPCEGNGTLFLYAWEGERSRVSWSVAVLH